eukprot:TRINITY_DN4002_c0_g2_i4.p2 TRINITY_DN4002_c0_g2~~TRINITY_DN4002_c0_g2_i4.p2  ORF type:complete len:100 (-),score=5.04 TRINITY_DN4002_c0_g2_i4:57-356(-)
MLIRNGALSPITVQLPDLLKENKGMVFTMSGGMGTLAGRLQYFPTDMNKLEKLIFPLFSYTINSIEAHCGINVKNQTTLSIAIRDDEKGEIFMIRGTMH